MSTLLLGSPHGFLAFLSLGTRRTQVAARSLILAGGSIHKLADSESGARSKTSVAVPRVRSANVKRRQLESYSPISKPTMVGIRGEPPRKRTGERAALE